MVLAKIFARNVPQSINILQKCQVAIAGLGGLGSNVAIALARSGIGSLILADFDIIEESNLNRQHYFLLDLGKKKTKALSQYLKNINPQIQLKIFEQKLTPDNISAFYQGADLLIEAFDRAEEKKWLIETWVQHYPYKVVIGASGLSGVGKTDSIRVIRAGKIIICGDFSSDQTLGLCAARVAIVANMQANIAIEELLNEYL